MPTTELTLPRLAVGSHSYTRAYGCAMNVMSWENGDTVISDMPSCTATLLAKMVHQVNDSYCTHTTASDLGLFGGCVSLLCAPCSTDVLDLAHRTVGTSGTREEVRRWGWLWAEQLLIGERGVLRNVNLWTAGREYILAAAAATRRYADGETSRIDPDPRFGRLIPQVPDPAMQQALRLASLVYQGQADMTDRHDRRRHVHPSIGPAYLGALTRQHPWGFHFGLHSREEMLAGAHAAVDAWLAVMSVPTPEAAKAEAEAPALVAA
jgi:hypothetical protein